MYSPDHQNLEEMNREDLGRGPSRNRDKRGFPIENISYTDAEDSMRRLGQQGDPGGALTHLLPRFPRPFPYTQEETSPPQRSKDNSSIISCIIKDNSQSIAQIVHILYSLFSYPESRNHNVETLFLNVTVEYGVRSGDKR